MSSLALIYVRKSVVRYDEDRASPERQLANCVRVCEEKGWRYEVYEDAEGHRSGRSEKHRPRWRGLKAALGRPAVVVVVVNSLDRASRSPSDFFNFVDLVQDHDVELVSLHEQFDTTTASGGAMDGGEAIGTGMAYLPPLGRLLQVGRFPAIAGLTKELDVPCCVASTL